MKIRKIRILIIVKMKKKILTDNVQENIIKSEDNKIVNESDKLNINDNNQIK